MMFNLDSPVTSQQITSLDLTTAMILGIFTGTITTWGQLATNGLNPELAGDNTAITTVFRTDASGENYILSDYLNTIDPSAWAKYTSTLNFPGGPQAIWPFPQGTGAIRVTTSRGTVRADLTTPPITCTRTRGASRTSRRHTRRSPRSVRLRPESPGRRIRAAFGPRRRRGAFERQARARPRAALDRCLHRHQSQGYTISAYSYLVTPEGQMNRAEGAVLGQFVQFFACQGQQSAEQLGYSPLPPNLVDDDFQGIKRIAGAAPPPSVGQRTNLQRPLCVAFRRIRSTALRAGAEVGGGGTDENRRRLDRRWWSWRRHDLGDHSPDRRHRGVLERWRVCFRRRNRGFGAGGRRPVVTTPVEERPRPGPHSRALVRRNRAPGRPRAMPRPPPCRGRSGSVPRGTSSRPAASGTPMLYISFGFLLLVAVPPSVAWTGSETPPDEGGLMARGACTTEGATAQRECHDPKCRSRRGGP